jgi:hypothetical protein
MLLISKTDFLPYRNLTINMDDSKRLEPFILEAQRIDLCNMLGKRLYFDLINHIESYTTGIAAQTDGHPYQPIADETWFNQLLNGSSYSYTWTDGATTTKQYAGLKPVLVYLSFARFVRSDNIRSTQSGFVKKTVDFSTQISDKEIQAVAARAETDANAFFSAVQDFMADNPAYFNKYLHGGGVGHALPAEKRFGVTLKAIKHK